MDINSDSMPKVSIALCTYNGEKFLAQQLNSILDQTYQNIDEIICIDDKSTDGTWKLLEEFAKKDSRFSIHLNETNLGYIKNFEKAVKLCRNNYIAISDQDDIWDLTKITKLMSAIGENMMVYSDNEYIDDNNQTLNKKFSDYRNLSEIKGCLSFCLMSGVSGHTFLFKKELLKFALPFHEGIPHDYWLAFHASQHSPISFVDEPLVKYRQHNNNVIGATGVRTKESDKNEIKKKVDILASATKYASKEEQQVYNELAHILKDFTLGARLRKVVLFMKHRKEILQFKKRNDLRKMFYCIKMFWKNL